MTSARKFLAGLALMLMATGGLLSVKPALADTLEMTLRIREHAFEPAELRVPAGKKIKLHVFNDDATPEEFESFELNREKVISGKSRAIVFIGPLKPGTYPFFGEFNPETAQGRIIAE